MYIINVSSASPKLIISGLWLCFKWDNRIISSKETHKSHMQYQEPETWKPIHILNTYRLVPKGGGRCEADLEPGITVNDN